MKATIWKSGKEIKYALSNAYIQEDQGLDQVIIKFKLVTRLKLKVKPSNTLASQRLGMPVTNEDFTDFKS